MFFLILTALGMGMAAAGIVKDVRVAKNNRQIENDSKEWCCRCICIYCHNTVYSELTEFASHRNYPEGYIYYPYCKKPLSKNLFEYIRAEEKTK